MKIIQKLVILTLSFIRSIVMLNIIRLNWKNVKKIKYKFTSTNIHNIDAVKITWSEINSINFSFSKIGWNRYSEGGLGSKFPFETKNVREYWWSRQLTMQTDRILNVTNCEGYLQASQLYPTICSTFTNINSI